MILIKEYGKTKRSASCEQLLPCWSPLTPDQEHTCPETSWVCSACVSAGQEKFTRVASGASWKDLGVEGVSRVTCVLNGSKRDQEVGVSPGLAALKKLGGVWWLGVSIFIHEAGGLKWGRVITGQEAPASERKCQLEDAGVYPLGGQKVTWSKSAFSPVLCGGDASVGLSSWPASLLSTFLLHRPPSAGVTSLSFFTGLGSF